LQQPRRRSARPAERQRVVALGHGAIRARTISSARRRFNVDVVLD
jgi:hypothetical protein